MYNFFPLSLLSAQAFVNQDLKTCPIKLNNQNPNYILASAIKSSPTYLHCDVTVDIDETLRSDLSRRQFYVAPDEDDDDDNAPHHDPEEVRKFYQMQKQEHNKESVNNSPDLTSALKVEKRTNKKTTNGVYSLRRARRDAATHELISYEWLRNDNSFISTTNDSTNQVINHDGYALFPNGTLKFQVTSLSTGVYRCRATYKHTKQDYDIGPILSTSTTVELACELNRRVLKTAWP
jgi:hypothetical protein